LKIVVGLGNPGKEYSRTRHNLGYLAVEEFCRRAGLRWSGSECRCRTAKGRLGRERIVVAEPRTFMNASGEAVACLLERSGAEAVDLLVVCDDAALDLGTVRVRPSGSDGGHRGLRSIAQEIGTEQFPRLRIGIRTAETGREGLADHVLSAFEGAEVGRADEAVVRTAECIRVVLEQGLAIAMNRYNRRQPREPGEPPAAG